NYPSALSNISVINGISDHQALTFSVESLKLMEPKIKRNVFLYSKADVKGIEHFFQSNFSSFTEFSNCNSVNDTWKLFVSIANRAASMFIPQKAVTVNSDVPYVDNELKKLKQKCRILHSKRNRSRKDLDKYLEQNRRYKNLLKFKKANYLKSTLDEYSRGDTKKFYNFLKSQKSSSSKIPNLLDEHGAVINLDKEK